MLSEHVYGSSKSRENCAAAVCLRPILFANCLPFWLRSGITFGSSAALFFGVARPKKPVEGCFLFTSGVLRNKGRYTLADLVIYNPLDMCLCTQGIYIVRFGHC
jgi:hypothetical protein